MQFPGISPNATLEELRESLAQQNEFMQWLVNHLEDKNILGLNGGKLDDNSVDGSAKAIDLSVPNGKIANGVDGAKLIALSVLDSVIAGMNGSKLAALSAPYGSLRNLRQSGYVSISIPSGTPPSVTIYPATGLITHSQILAMPTPPMIRAGTTGSYVHPVQNVNFPSWNSGVYFKIWQYTESGFNIIIENDTGAAQTIPFYWYRDGIY